MRWGCPHSYGTPWVDGEGDGFKGQGIIFFRDGDQRTQKEAGDWEKTCPQYYRRSPFFCSLWDELEDYKKGRLGALGVLSSAHLAYLRVLEAEDEIFTNYWEAKLTPDPKR